jgi:hypothetical protein
MKKTLVLTAAIVLATLLAACGASNTPTPTARPTPDAAALSTGPDADGDGIPDGAESLLGSDPKTSDSDGDGQKDKDDANPVSAANPIAETSTTVGFTINSILVENNVDASNQAVPDHLELSLTNTGAADLNNFDMYYTITDLTTNQAQSFYYKLPGFSLAKGETKSLHFDNTGQPNHISVNPNSMYYVDHNQLRVDVILHAPGYAPQTATVKKDAGVEGAGE